MNRINNYFKETYQELTQKVSWPTWPELQASAMVVAVASLIIAIMVWAMDYSSNLVLTTFYKALS